MSLVGSTPPPTIKSQKSEISAPQSKSRYFKRDALHKRDDVLAISLRSFYRYNVTAQIMMNESQEDLKFAEVTPILDVISRLAPLKLVSDPSFMAGTLRVCFQNHQAFSRLTTALGRFQGNCSWLLLARVSLVCLMPVPDKGKIQDLLDHGIDTPWKFRQMDPAGHRSPRSIPGTRT